MERLQAFTDPAIGVNPFALSRPRAPLSAQGLVLLTLRAPPLAATLLLLVLVHYLLRKLPSAPAHYLRSLIERPLARLALVFLGFLHIDEREAQRSLLAASALTAAASPPPPVGRGLVIANSCGFVDLLLWSALLAPTFARVSDNGAALCEASLPQMVRAAVEPDQAVEGSSVRALEWLGRELHRQASAGPLLLLPEGAPTNGKSVLEFAPAAAMIGALPLTRRPLVRLLALRYNSTPNPCFVGGNESALALVMQLLMSPSNEVQVLRVPLDATPQLPDLASPAAGRAWASACREVLLRALRVKGVRFDWRAHRSFVEATRPRLRR